MRYVIHVGPHKTGTTYLQQCFKASRTALAERGIGFPATWEHSPGSPSHFHLAEKLFQRQFEAVAADLRALAAPGIHTLLISSEYLSTLDEAGWAGFKECLAGADVKIVFYLRRWSELVPSAWQEQVKQGHAATLPETVQLQLRNPEAVPLLNWERRIAAPLAVFGRDSIRLVAYSLLRARDIDIFRHFAQVFLEWPDAAIPMLAPPNASRDVREIEILRALAAMSRRQGHPPTSALRSAFDRQRSDFDLTLIEAAMEQHRRTLMFHDDAGSLGLLHERLFSSLKDLLTPPHMAHRLFRPQAVPLPYIGGDYMAEPGVASTLRGLYAAIRPGAGDA